MATYLFESEADKKIRARGGDGKVERFHMFKISLFVSSAAVAME